jgi:AraC family transcriptional regulator
VNFLENVQRGIDYIEANLDIDIDLGDVARHAGISHWHFQRIFKALTNETLKTYIRSRRFAGSLEALATTDRRILEIAFAAGFETQESFTRAFKKAFGVTPADYRKRQRQFPFLRKVKFDADYLTHIHKNISLEPEVYEQSAAYFVGLSTRFFSVDSEKNNIANKLPALWNAFLPRLREIENRLRGVCFGVIRQTPERNDELDYSAVVEVNRVAPLPIGMVHIELPATKYAKFAHRGNIANLDKTVNYIYSSWLLRAQARHTYGCDLEFYGADYAPNSDDSLVHYAIPIEDA